MFVQDYFKFKDVVYFNFPYLLHTLSSLHVGVTTIVFTPLQLFSYWLLFSCFSYFTDQ